MKIIKVYFRCIRKCQDVIFVQSVNTNLKVNNKEILDGARRIIRQLMKLKGETFLQWHTVIFLDYDSRDTHEPSTQI